MNSEILRGSIFRACPDILSTSLDDGAVLLELREGTYFGLNLVGQYIWDLLQGEIEFLTIEKKLRCEFDASSKILRADLTGFLQTLLNYELIQQVDESR